MTLQKTNGRVIKISATASRDLKGIWEYVSEHNEVTATKLVKEINNKFTLLRDNPFIGREQDKYLVGLRSFVVRRYFIFYLPIENGVLHCPRR